MKKELLISLQEFEESEQYWSEKLSGELKDARLTGDFPHTRQYESAGYRAAFGSQMEEKLAHISKNNDLSLYIILLTAFKILLFKYTRQNDIIVVSPIYTSSNREYNKFVALRDSLHPRMTFKELLMEVKQTVLEGYKNEHYPIEKLIQYLDIEDNSMLFGNIFLYEHIHSKEFVNGPIADSVNDIVFSISKNDGHLEGELTYNARLFKKETVQRLLDCYLLILSRVLDETGVEISEIELMREEEQHRLLYEFNQTAEEYAGDKTIQQLFEEQVERNPDAVAVWTSLDSPAPALAVNGSKNEMPGLHLDYRSLNSRANQLANELRARGVAANSIVGIMVEHPLEKVVSILGVLKTGGAFLPIEPAYPGRLKAYMCKESKMQLLVTEHSFVNTLPQEFSAIPIVSVDAEGLACHSTTNLEIVDKPSDLAYVIFTSGTTGKPKGSLVEHRGVVNYANWRIQTYQCTPKDITLQLLSYCFDGFGSNFYSCLLSGGSLIMVPDSRKLDYGHIKEIVRHKQVTNISLVPPMYQALLDSSEKGDLESLRFVVLAGDKSSVRLMEQSRAAIPHLLLFNEYGPTEATVTATGRSNLDESSTAVIGRPIFNARIYVLDPSFKPVPVNVPGELCIAGVGAARGYLNRPELTHDQFIDASFINGERIYLSGDLARWLPDGNIELLGRIDHQVKIRGFRIEPLEIENRLLQQENVKEVLVLAKEDEKGDKYLCAYIVAEQDFDTSALRDRLSRRLPDYMVPSYFVLLEEFPLTSNGKIDRKALPEPGIRVSSSSMAYAAPGNEKEEKLVEIWKHVLGRDEIGITNNFFDLGGDSIKAIQISARMNKAGYKVEVRDIFQYPQISALAPLVKEIGQIADQSAVTGTVPLTPIQCWFFGRKFVDRHYFNQAVMLQSKNEAGFAEDAIKRIFLKLQEHHDVFRMTYKEPNGEIVQTCHESIPPLSLQVCDLRDYEDKSKALKVLESTANEIQASIDMEQGPLMKLGLFRLDDGDRLLIVIHHLLIDGVSWRILLEDIESLYRQWEKGEDLVLPSKTDSFKHWSEQLSQYADNRIFLKKEKKYWAELESTQIPALKTDFDIEENYIKDAETLSFELDEDETNLLLTKVNRAFGTEINDILLAALGLAVKESLGCSRLLVALEGHGREEILKNIDTSRTVGWFTSEYPVLLNFSYDGDLSRLMKETKETLHQVPHKGIGYGILRYLTAEEHKKEFDIKLKPQIGFNYLGQFGAELNEASFRLANESTGNLLSTREKREHALEVSGIIVNNRLKMSITYNRKQYKTKIINTLLEHYKTDLSKIISYCSARKERTLTPSDFTYKGFTIETVDQLTAQYEIEDLYPLSPMQDGILFHSLYGENPAAFFGQLSYRFYMELDVAILEKSLIELFKRHRILRTIFVHVGVPRPVQIVLKERQADFSYEDLDKTVGGTSARKDKFIAEFKEKEKRRSFDLSKDVLMRIAVFRADKSEYEFILSSHHILMDGWCMGIIYGELLRIFESVKAGKSPELEPVVPYSTYIEWLEQQDHEYGLNCWREYLEGCEQPAGLQKFRKKPAVYRYKKEECRLYLDKHLTAGLTKMANDKQLTINTAFLTAWGILLHIYNRSNDVVFGEIVSGRPAEIEGIETMIGLFVNSVPVRIKADGKERFSNLAENVQQQTVRLQPHEYLPLAEIQSVSPLKRNLLDHLVAFENYPIDDEVKEADTGEGIGLAIDNMAMDENPVYDLNIGVIPGDSYIIRFVFNENVFAKAFVEKIISHLDMIIKQVVKNPDIELNKIEILDEKVSQLLDSNTHDHGAILRPFEAELTMRPDDKAIACKSESISFRKLNEKAGQTAQILKSRVLKGDANVGLMVERSADKITGMLGTLMAGGTYSIIDSRLSRDQAVSLLDDANVSILLTTADSVTGLSFIELQNLKSRRVTPHSTAARPRIRDLDSLPVIDRSLVDYEKYSQYLSGSLVTDCMSLQASRGCPYLCTYCHKLWPKQQISRSAENIFEEVRALYNMGVRRFSIVDDIFNLDVKTSSRFFNLVIKNGMDLQLFFSNGLRGDLLTEDYIDLMVEAGTTRLSLALETGSPRLQKLIKKNLNIDRLYRNAAYFCEKHPQVILELFTMHGFPTETREEAMKTLEFIKKLKWLHFPHINILKIYPGTEMEKMTIEHGISPIAIEQNENLGYHEIPDTLPFDKGFTRQYQTRFIKDYFLSKERLLHVLPRQMAILTEDEMVRAYNSYSPTQITNFSDLLQFVNISIDELNVKKCLDRDSVRVPDLNQKTREYFKSGEVKVSDQSLGILLLDLCQFFDSKKEEISEQPSLGLLYLLTDLNRRYGNQVNGKIAKSFIDFNNYSQLKLLLEEFKPDVIGVRALSFFKDFFHQTIAMIRQWGINVPIVAGGPYATSSYETVLQDRNVDVVVMGEGELTFAEFIGNMLENGRKLPGEKQLEKIAGIVYIPGKEKYTHQLSREIIFLDDFPGALSKDVGAEETDAAGLDDQYLFNPPLNFDF